MKDKCSQNYAENKEYCEKMVLLPIFKIKKAGPDNSQKIKLCYFDEIPNDLKEKIFKDSNNIGSLFDVEHNADPSSIDYSFSYVSKGDKKAIILTLNANTPLPNLEITIFPKLFNMIDMVYFLKYSDLSGTSASNGRLLQD